MVIPVLKKMKILLLNGSPNTKGCTYTALSEVAKTINEGGIETEIIHVGHKDIRGCIACGKCQELGHCVFDDLVNEIAPKLEAADGLVVGSPVYYAGPNGTLTNLLDRLFWRCLLSAVCFLVVFKAVTMLTIECIEGYIYLFIPIVGLFISADAHYKKRQRPAA